MVAVSGLGKALGMCVTCSELESGHNSAYTRDGEAECGLQVSLAPQATPLSSLALHPPGLLLLV